MPARDAFLDEATAKAFAAVTQAPRNARAEVRGLSKAASEHRLLLWSANSHLENDILPTDVSGSLPAVDGSTPTIGIFRNDATGGKLSYYAGGSAAGQGRSMQRERRPSADRYRQPDLLGTGERAVAVRPRVQEGRAIRIAYQRHDLRARVRHHQRRHR